MPKMFVWFLLPVIPAAFFAVYRYHRSRNAVLTGLPILMLPLTGLVLFCAGGLAGTGAAACALLGLAHLCWFACLVRRGRFSWPTAGLLTLFLVPLLGVLVLPDTSKLPFGGYALCTLLSVSAAAGARRSPGGLLCLAGLLTQLLADFRLGLGEADLHGLSPAPGLLSLVSAILLLASLVRCIPALPPEPDPVLPPDPVRRYRHAKIMLAVGLVIPLFILAAMIFYNGHYSWYRNIISESGFLYVEKRPNRFSAWLLSTGLTASGLLCAWYFYECSRWGLARRWQKALILFFGVTGGLGLLGIAAAPLDRYPDLHLFFTLCSGPFALAILFSLLTPGDCFGRRSEKLIWLVFAAFNIVILETLAYLITLKKDGLPHIPTDPIIQKIAVTGFYIYMLGQMVTYAVNARREAAAEARPYSGQ